MLAQANEWASSAGLACFVALILDFPQVAALEGSAGVIAAQAFSLGRMQAQLQDEIVLLSISRPVCSCCQAHCRTTLPFREHQEPYHPNLPSAPRETPDPPPSLTNNHLRAIPRSAPWNFSLLMIRDELLSLRAVCVQCHCNGSRHMCMEDTLADAVLHCLVHAPFFKCMCLALQRRAPMNIIEKLRPLAASVVQSLSVEIDLFSTGYLSSLNRREMTTDDDLSTDGPKIEIDEKKKCRKNRAQLKVTTFNANSWTTAKAFLRMTGANLVFIQEHKITSSGIPEAQLWAKNSGWTSFWAPARATLAGGTSGGVAIFVRQHMQAWIPENNISIFMEARGLGVMVSAGGLGTFLAISCYFHTNNVAKVKATAANLQMLAALGQLIGTSSVPAVIGADWNMEPEVLKSTGFLDTFQLKLAHEPSSLGSCISSGGRNVSNIDYFALSKTLSDVLEGNVYFCKLTPPRPHRPTHVDFSPRPKAIQVQVLKELKALPVDPPFGPQPPPSEWGREAAGISVKLSGYLAGVQVGDHFPVIPDAGKTQAKKDLDEAMTIWFEKVENDVQYVM